MTMCSFNYQSLALSSESVGTKASMFELEELVLMWLYMLVGANNNIDVSIICSFVCLCLRILKKIHVESCEVKVLVDSVTTFCEGITLTE